MTILFSAILALALVPAPRDFTAADGVYSVTSRVSYSATEWYDFDSVGACLAQARVTERTDRSLPAEGYRLVVGRDGVSIASADAAGAFYARQTLRQLVVASSTNAVDIRCCRVSDWPAYRWRGMLLDVARYFHPVDVVKKTLKLMAMHKLNVFHWHLTDDQGWRIELKRHPELTEYGAVRPRSVRFGTHQSWKPPARKMEQEFDNDRYGPFFYSQDDVREILAYAKGLQITVVPEIELPGHAEALLAAHPELVCEGRSHSRSPAADWGVHRDVVCAGNDGALALYRDVFDEVCELFPDSPYVHIGGDECPDDNWKGCAKCQARMKREGIADAGGLHAWMVTQIVKHLSARGRRAVGWDEVFAGDVPASTVGMVWRTSSPDEAPKGSLSVLEAIRRGHDLVMAPNGYCYLCWMQEIPHDPYPYYHPWPNGTRISLEKAYSFDPCRGIPEDGRGHVIGGEACMWGESTATVFDLEWKTWPRACALAECLWLGEAKPGYEDFRRRMKEHRIRLMDMHVNCATFQE